MYFQTLDDKSECVGVYVDGKLHFDKTPPDLTRTWKYTGSVTEPHIEYAWLYAHGAPLEEVCPPHLKKNLLKAQKRFLAHLKAFELGKINLREHCFYDLIPKTFLLEFCEIRNQITKHVFESFEKPQNYDLLADFQKLLHKIQYQNLNLNKMLEKTSQFAFLNSLMFAISICISILSRPTKLINVGNCLICKYRV